MNKLIVFFLFISFVGCAFDPKQKVEIESVFSIENMTNDTLYVNILNQNSLEINLKTTSFSNELFTNDICYNESDLTTLKKYRLLPKLSTDFYSNKKWHPNEVTDSIYFYFKKEKVNSKNLKSDKNINKQMYEMKSVYSFNKILKHKFKLVLTN